MLALLQTDDGEVARAATDIGDQDQFLGLHRLVIMGGGDRLGTKTMSRKPAWRETASSTAWERASLFVWYVCGDGSAS
jgi:hypothetical protein